MKFAFVYYIGYTFNIKPKQIQHKPVSFGLLIVTKLSSYMTYMKQTDKQRDKKTMNDI